MNIGAIIPHPAPILRKDRNALKATGPRTAEGKVTSSRNSLKHGLTARQVVIPGENQADFDQLLAGIAADRKPEGELEIQIVGEIAACTWRLARARAREAEALDITSNLFTSNKTDSASGFDRLLRYMSSIERQLNCSIVRLQQLQANRLKQEPAEKPKVMAAGASISTTFNEPEFVSSTAQTHPEPVPTAEPPSTNH